MSEPSEKTSAGRDKSRAWLPIGIGVGTAVGVATGQLGLWLALGVALGAAMRVKARRSDPG